MVIFNSYVTNHQRVNTVKKGILPWLAEYLSTVFLWDPHLGRNARNGVRRRRHSFEIEYDHRFRLPFHTANPMYVFMLSYLISVYMYIWMPYSYIYIYMFEHLFTEKIRPRLDTRLKSWPIPEVHPIWLGIFPLWRGPFWTFYLFTVGKWWFIVEL